MGTEALATLLSPTRGIKGHVPYAGQLFWRPLSPVAACINGIEPKNAHTGTQERRCRYENLLHFVFFARVRALPCGYAGTICRSATNSARASSASSNPMRVSTARSTA